MNIILKRIHMENFKVFKNTTINFGLLTKIFAQNYKGKSSIVDGFFWTLFGKSSTGNSEGKQFTPRRYEVDTEGNQIPIDHVDVVVELVLDVDGREITIKKTQIQKWVRKRGDEIQTYEGDKNVYHWNEVEVSETEHKRRVAELVDEDVFRLITNPHAFVGKKQDEQRKFLVEKVAQITDSDVLSIDGSFAILRSRLIDEGKTLEEVKAINKKALQGYKSQQETIPVRIDEVSKAIIDIDFSDKELQLSALKDQLAEFERKLSDTSEAYGEVTKIKTEIAEYRSKMNEIENSEKTLLSKKKQEATSKLDSIAYNLLSKIRQSAVIKSNTEHLKNNISIQEEKFNNLRKQFADLKAEKGTSHKTTCPQCKNTYTFYDTSNRDVEMKKINEDGKNTKDELDMLKAQLTDDETQITELTVEVEKLTTEELAVKEELAKLPTEIDLSSNAIYQGYKSTITALEFALAETQKSLADTDIIKAELTARKADIASQIEVLQGVIASKKHIDDARDRVEELRAELKAATAKAAECERLDFEIEKFEKVKRNLLSEKINGRFRKVKWLLYRNQKNGGIEDTCVCMINGSVYGENTTSTTERLMAGLDIVGTLQNIWGVRAPIFIDNSEAYNQHNVPVMDCQIVQLFVSEDKEIKVVCEE